MSRRLLAMSLLVLSGVFGALLASLPDPSARAWGQEEVKSPYIGVAKCKMCHRDRYESWLDDKHSKATDALKPEDFARPAQGKVPACVKCHSTGFGLPGGFESTATTPGMAGVSCEGCHGPGRAHADLIIKSLLTKNDDEAELMKQARATVNKGGTCGGCHDPHLNYHEICAGK